MKGLFCVSENYQEKLWLPVSVILNMMYRNFNLSSHLVGFASLKVAEHLRRLLSVGESFIPLTHTYHEAH